MISTISTYNRKVIFFNSILNIHFNYLQGHGIFRAFLAKYQHIYYWKDEGMRTKSWLNTARKKGTMYSKEQYHKALEVYEETISITKTITILGYPKRRQTLYNWLNRKRMLPEDKSTFRGYNSKDHPRHPSLKLKLEALHHCFELGEDVQSVANEIGYSTASIYT